MTRRVYFIRPIGMDGPIKIGCSGSPNRRRATLETWSPFALEIVAEIEGEFETERRFHARHADAHQHGEWFLATPELLADIAAIQAGAFDTACLPEPKCVTNGRKGRTWTAGQHEAARMRKREKDIRKALGLCPPWPCDPETHEKFLDDPVSYGVTEAELKRRWDDYLKASNRERAAAMIAQANRLLGVKAA